MTRTGRSKKVILAEPRGFCAGVRRAILIVEEALTKYGPPVYVRKEIVHNQHVVRSLRQRGAVFVESEEEVPEGAVCIFSAHGVSPAVRANATRRELTVIDATCPLVAKVHQEARRHARDGKTILLIGHANHEEVEGTFGHAPDRTIIVDSVETAQNLTLAPDATVGYLTQTTLSLDETSDIVDALNARFPAMAGPAKGDICYASQNRQNAVKAIAARSDLILVVGSTNSSNSIRMVEVARNTGAAAHLVPEVADLREEWLRDVSVVGVSAGASAPEILVEQLLDRLAEHGFRDLELEQTAVENVVFGLPSSLTNGESAHAS
ncbi:4-hydroxy-3-methylbut-2-enyl diphosphate reductase [Micromonospora sp. WMMD1120]|uniref:4-hydroxy-3-methylbut-2-enyl diphosphate reductase n=1 Tax=Micromonospora sp. WMMD1120 TaxID=3016106 RepID=UPI0024162BE8|nr:4-hydroxy-3-methylbut-2-enyl diphosphate reductase [Micromonospora sp. WMMD1120]MDG4809548.1 4-hydroxy-3-methylbut-2-enyl diphosphate reductase [Micromonospora sp. WMMD1120]